jgi:hypothetical protein
MNKNDLMRRAQEMCRQHNTKQCAAICLSHSCLIPIGECPSLLEVWTEMMIEKHQMKIEQWQIDDALWSYAEAIAEIRRRVKSGE